MCPQARRVLDLPEGDDFEDDLLAEAELHGSPVCTCQQQYAMYENGINTQMEPDPFCPVHGIP